jgi:hypothetical protein
MRTMVGGWGGGSATDDEIITFALPVEKNTINKSGEQLSNTAVSNEDYVAREM